jgi:hypothetical protein
MPVIQDLAGHASITMTRRYTHPADERKQQAVEALLARESQRVRTRHGIRYGDGEITQRPNGGSNKPEQVNKLDGRPVRARTADLHRVNCVVRKVNLFACFAFPVLTIAKMPQNDRVLVTNW